MKGLTIESQYNYDYKKQWIPEMDDEILTVQNDSISIREMLMRDMAGTLDARFDSGFYDYDGEEDPDFDGSEFMEIRDMDDVHFMRNYLDAMELRFKEDNQLIDSLQKTDVKEENNDEEATDQ